MRSISRHWNASMQTLPIALTSDKKEVGHVLRSTKPECTANKEFRQQTHLHIRSKILLSNYLLCLPIRGINEILLRMNIFTFRPPLSSGNIGTFKDCLLLEQGRDDLLFSLFLSLSTCMHADANNLTSSVSKRKQIKIMFGLFCFPKLQPIHWHLPCKSHISSNWWTKQMNSQTFFLSWPIFPCLLPTQWAAVLSLL